MNNVTFRKFALVALTVATTLVASVAAARPGPGGRGPGPGGHRPPPAPMHHHSSYHHHGGHGWAVGAGLLGAGLIAGAIVDAVVPSTTVVYPTTTYVQSAPVTTVSAAPVTVGAAPAVGGYYVNQTQQVWVEGCWADQIQANGAVVRVWQPGHYETRTVPVWVTR